jgi:hypothetical protein
MFRNRLCIIAFLLLMLTPATSISAALPSSTEIAQAAATAKLTDENSVTLTQSVDHASFNDLAAVMRVGQPASSKLTFTPIDLSNIRSASELNRKVVGVLQTSFSVFETGIPPGKYYVYFVKNGNSWTSYFESEGKILSQVASVKFRQLAKPEGPATATAGDIHFCIFDHWGCVYPQK